MGLINVKIMIIILPVGSKFSYSKIYPWKNAIFRCYSISQGNSLCYLCHHFVINTRLQENLQIKCHTVQLDRNHFIQLSTLRTYLQEASFPFPVQYLQVFFHPYLSCEEPPLILAGLADMSTAE